MTRSSPVLELTDVSVAYGAARAVDHVSIQVRPGEVVGLIGANGAGKTSLIDAVTGFAAATGSIRLDEVELISRPPHVRARAGVARTWQQGELFDDLTIRDNLRVVVEPVSLWRALLDVVRPRRHETEAIVDEVLARLGLTSVAETLPTEVSQGQRRLAGVARALVAEPAAVLLDEPAAGLSPNESVRLGATITDVAAMGVAVLLVEHDVSLVLSVCSRIYVLEQGRMLAAGTPAEVRSHPEVIRSYLGRSGEPAAREVER